MGGGKYCIGVGGVKRGVVDGSVDVVQRYMMSGRPVRDRRGRWISGETHTWNGRSC